MSDNNNELYEIEKTKEEQNEQVNQEINIVNKKTNKKSIISTVLVATLVGTVCSWGGYEYGKEVGKTLPQTSKKYDENQVVATVGESEITQEHLRQKVEPYFYAQPDVEFTAEEIKAYEASMIDYMTTTEVLYLAGIENGVKVEQEDVEKEYETIMKSIEEQIGLTEDTIVNKIDISVEDIKLSLEKELVATQYIGKASEITDQEVTDYYSANREEFEEIEASHILISTKNDDGTPLEEKEIANKKEEAQSILDRAKNGEDFATLAKEYSQDLGSGANGGSLGSFGKGEMVAEFEAAAFNLEVGQLTDELVETDFGYHIILKTNESTKELDEVADKLKYSLGYEKQTKILDELMAKYEVKTDF